jgi:thiamine-phosphate pyrophosphorylase
MDARLYLIVTPQLCGPRGVAATVRAAIEGGVDLVQLRDKEAPDAAFAAMARDLAAVCRERGVPLILNDRAHLLEETGADGVHVGREDHRPEDLRARFGDGPIVGLSTHDRAEVAAARGRGADYVGLGPMFRTATKTLTRTPRGRAMVLDAAGATTLPVFPIGGIRPDNAPELIAAGAVRLAVSAAICGAPDPRAAAAAFRALLRNESGAPDRPAPRGS